MSFKIVLGVVLLAAGAVFSIFLRDVELGAVSGGMIGLALLFLGVIDLFEALRTRTGKKPKGVLEELGQDFGLRRGGQGPRDDRGRDA